MKENIISENKILGVVEHVWFGYSDDSKDLRLTIDVETYIHGQFRFSYPCEEASKLLGHYNVRDICLLETTPVILQMVDNEYKLVEIVRGRRLQ